MGSTSHHTIAELAKKHKLHPTQINLWKKQLLDGAELAFEGGGKAEKGKSECLARLLPRLASASAK